MVLISLVQSKSHEYKLDGATALKISRETIGAEARLEFIHEVLDALKRPATT
jgi:transcription-repair coupling factor (superfamily II helicase)